MSATAQDREPNYFEITILDMRPSPDMEDLAPVERPWVIRSYNLADYLDTGTSSGLRDNHAAEEIVKQELKAKAQNLLLKVEFASEMGCFFAYAKNYSDALLVVGIIYIIVADSMTKEEQ